MDSISSSVSFCTLCDTLCFASFLLVSVSPSVSFCTLFDTLCHASSLIVYVYFSVAFCILCYVFCLKFDLLSVEFSRNRCLNVKQKPKVKCVQLAVLLRCRSLANRLFLSMAVSIVNILYIRIIDTNY